MIRGRWYVLYGASDYASPPRDQISALLKQMTIFSSRICCSFFPLLELQTEGAAQHDIDWNVVVCLSNLIKDHSCERPCWLHTFLLTVLFQCPSKLIRNLLKLDFTWASYRRHMAWWPLCFQFGHVNTACVMNFKANPWTYFQWVFWITSEYVICLKKSSDWCDTVVLMKYPHLNFLLEVIEEVATYLLLSPA